VAQGEAVVVELRRGGAVCPAVVPLGVPPEAEDEFAHGERGLCDFGLRSGCGLASAGQPLGDEAAVLLRDLGRRALRLGGPGAEVVVLAGQGDDGSAAGLVAAQGGDLARTELRHGCGECGAGKTVMYRLGCHVLGRTPVRRAVA
jgi:hypothetical protein